jgi:hypothetical protein
MYQMAAGMGALSMPAGKYETKLDCKLFALGQNSAKLASSVVSKTGSSGGFGWKNALSMGLNVGSMAFMGGAGMGFNPAMMNMFRMSPSLGAMGLGRAMRFDPRIDEHGRYGWNDEPGNARWDGNGRRHWGDGWHAAHDDGR